jgi:hypothetical protein
MVPELCPLDKNNKLVSCWNFAFPHTNVLKLKKKILTTIHRSGFRVMSCK